jgi:hypothetical protein
MPRAKPQRQTLDIPLTSGLAQKEDPRLVGPGQALVVQNFQKQKTGTIQKPLGYSAINATGPYGSFNAVLSLSTNKESLLEIVTDSYGPGLYKYASQIGAQSFITRAPEAYIAPAQTLAAFDQAITEMDALIVPASLSGLAGDISFHVFALDYYGNGNIRIFWMVRDQLSKTTIVTPREVNSFAAALGPGSHLLYPKLTLIGDNKGLLVMLTIMVAGLSTNIKATTIRPTSLTAWNSVVNLVTNADANIPYAVAPDDNDATHFALFYQKNSRTLTAARCVSATSPYVAASTTVTDTTYAGAAADLTGCAVRASTTAGGLWCAYAFHTVSAGVYTAYVRGSSVTWTSLGAVSTPVDLTNGLTSNYPGPRLLDIKPVPGTVAGNANSQQVVWSPPNVRIGFEPRYGATLSATPAPVAAIYQSMFYANAGTCALQNNQPRWTNGVTLASSMAISTEAGGTVAWVVGWVPSANLDPVASSIQSVVMPNVFQACYPPNVIISGANTLFGAFDGQYGGANITASLATAAPNSFSAYTYGNTSFYGAGGANFGGWTTSVVNPPVIANGGSGFTAPPNIYYQWGCGALLNINVNSTGRIVGINVATPPNSTHASLNWSSSVGTITSAGINVYPELIGSTITLSNCATPNNNGTFVITGINSPSFGYADVNINVSGPFNTGPDGNNGHITYVINGGSGAGNLYPPGATLPVWVLDESASVTYTNLATATVVAQGFSQGQLSGYVTLTGAASSANLNAANSGIIACRAFIPYPPGVAINVINGATNAQSSSGYLVPSIIVSLGQSNAYQNIQGSLYLFCMDTFADPSTPNDNGTNYVNTPMRWIGSLKPRFALNNMFASAYTLPKLQLGASPESSSSVYADLPINAAPNVAAPNMFEMTYTGYSNTATRAYQSEEIGGETAFAAGLPFMTDGTAGFEFAFPYYPENVTAYANIAHANLDLVGGGTFQYIFTYSGRDSSGNHAESERSVATSISTVPTYDPSYGYRTNLYVPTMGFSMRNHGTNLTSLASEAAQAPVSIHAYRTQNGGTVFHDLSATPAGVAQNSLWFPYVTISGLTPVTDAQLATQPLLYGDGSNGVTAGSIVDNQTPPAFQGIIAHKNRLWGFDGSNIYYSKAYTTGQQPAFNDQFAFSVDDGSFPVTALASMDERLIVFKRDRIFYVTGDGPADNGSGNDLQPPQRIQSNTGCVDWRSVVASPMGVFFLGDDDLCLLTRQMQVQPLGYFVADILAKYPVCTSAALDVSQGQLVWSFVASNGSGVLVCYSYALDYWCTQLLPTVATALRTVNQYASTGLDTQPTLTLGSNNLITGASMLSQRNAIPLGTANANYFFNNTYLSGTWSSPWVRASSEAGWIVPDEIMVEWDNLDPHKMTVTAQYDDSASVYDTWTVSAGAMSNASTPTIRWSFKPSRNMVKSMRINLTESADANVAAVTGQGPRIYGVSVRYGEKEGMIPTPIGQRGNG